MRFHWASVMAYRRVILLIIGQHRDWMTRPSKLPKGFRNEYFQPGKLKDFYFRTTDFRQDGGRLTCRWGNLLHSDLVGTPEFKTKQLRRLVSCCGDRVLKVTGANSSTSLREFFEHFDLNQAQAAALTSNHHNHIGVSLYFDDCRIDLEGYWTMCTAVHAKEVLDCLVAPLMDSKLATKCIFYPKNEKSFRTEEGICALLTGLEKLTGCEFPDDYRDEFIKIKNYN